MRYTAVVVAAAVATEKFRGEMRTVIVGDYRDATRTLDIADT